MAVYHLACRLIADPTKPNPPARVAKWQQACALASCERMIWKGDMISCTRDNEHGHRKGTEVRDTSMAIVTCGKCAAFGTNSKGPGAHAPGCLNDQAPATQRDPFPVVPQSTAAAIFDASASRIAILESDSVRLTRELRDACDALSRARAELADARNVIAAMRAVLAGAS